MNIRSNLAISESGFIFDPTTGESFTTNETGKEIINLLKSGKSEKEIKTYFLENFDVDESIFDKNYFDFFNLMTSLNLLSHE